MAGLHWFTPYLRLVYCLVHSNPNNGEAVLDESEDKNAQKWGAKPHLIQNWLASVDFHWSQIVTCFLSLNLSTINAVGRQFWLNLAWVALVYSFVHTNPTHISEGTVGNFCHLIPEPSSLGLFTLAQLCSGCKALQGLRTMMCDIGLLVCSL